MSVNKNNNALSEQLIAHFGLNADPFEGGFDAFFEGAQRQHNLETLRHMSTFGDMVLLLTGEKGSGKTTLINRFVQHGGDDLRLYISDANGSDGKDRKSSVISQMSASVGLSSVPGETTRQSFSRLLQSLEEQSQQDGTRSVLVFENADTLPKKELQFYFSYFSQLPKESGVVAIFTGSPSLLQVARLSNIEGDEEWLHQLQLKPFSASDTLEYLQLHLEKAGYKGLLELSESQVQHLVDRGKGLPGRINRLFGSVVLEPGSLKLPKNRNISTAKMLAVGMMALLGLSFLFVAYQYGYFESSDQSDMKVVVDEVSLEHDDSIARIQEEKKLEEERRLAQQKADRLRMLDKAISESVIDESKSAISEVKVAERRLVESKTVLDSKSPTNETDRPEIEPEQVEKVVDSDVLDKTVLPKAATDSTQSQVLTEKVKAPVDVSPLKTKPFFKSRDWVKSQSQKGYSAQILGSYNERTAIEFAQRVSKDASSIYYLETLHRGKPWFVVFYGVFPDKDSARRALKKAPKVIVAQKPWLRRFDAILSSYPQ